MAKFVYRMQNILNIKQKLETQAKMTYSLANQKYLEQQKILQEYMVRRVGYEQHWKKLMQGNLNLQEVEQPFMDMLELLKVSIYKSTRVIILLSSVGIFMHAVKTPEVVDLMAPLLLHLMPKSPTQCLLFFTILSPLVLYKGPFNLHGMGAGLSAVIISSTSMNPMVLGMALLSLNNLRKMMDPLDVQNIALMQYVDVDTNLVIKKILPYALSINYIMLFYALVAVV